MSPSRQKEPRWIWLLSGKGREFHQVACFRKTFTVSGESKDCRLELTADARYEVYVNGRWIGFGPARSWPDQWQLDSYDLSTALHAGDNVIAVRVQHYGIGNFQYLHCQAGLYAALTWKDQAGRQRMVSDDSWHGCLDRGYQWPVPRINCQLGWEEQYDARAGLEGFECLGYDEADWHPVNVLADEVAPHSKLVERKLPQLTRDTVYPSAVSHVDVVRTAPYSWSINPRELLNSTDKAANPLRGRMLLCTHIFSENAQEILLQQPHCRPTLEWKLNGVRLDFGPENGAEGRAVSMLRAGWNTLMTAMPPTEQFWWVVINATVEKDVVWAAYPDQWAETAWLALGPFGEPGDVDMPPSGEDLAITNPALVHADASEAEYDAIFQRGVLDTDDFKAAYVRLIPTSMIARDDIYALCASEVLVESLRPVIVNSDALIASDSGWACIEPCSEHDVRVLLDFGQEQVGFLAFDIEAKAGAVLDFHFTESVSAEGEPFLMSEMNNTFRYVCREGEQCYRSLLRRGFRYCRVSFRKLKHAVKIRSCRVISSTYPQARQGSFTCSDNELNRIWEVGAHTLACCSEDTYTDCPGYEQAFWVGDARNEALVDFVVNGDPRLSEYCWELAARSLDRSELVECMAPCAWQNILPAWSFLWMRWAEEHYRYSGDLVFARRMIEPLRTTVACISGHLSPRGLFQMRASAMFDWARMDTPADGEVTHLNALAMLGLKAAAALADSLGEGELRRDCIELTNTLGRAINTHLWSSREQAYVDCLHPGGSQSKVFSQQTQTVVFLSGAAEGERLERCKQYMGEAPAHFVRGGSPFFMSFVLEGLSRQHDSMGLLALIRDYWGMQIKAGATTFWEQYFPDQERMTRSFCHGWSASPVYFLSHCVLGIQPLRPGFEEVLIAPECGDLKWARGTMPSPHGLIAIDWELNEHAHTFELNLALPKPLPVLLKLPIRGRIELLEGIDEKHGMAGEGISFQSDGATIIRVKLTNISRVRPDEPDLAAAI